MFFPFQIRSGKRDSDSRPQPWQGCALPTELLPHAIRCEEKETRTPTTQLSLPPQSSASTNSAISPNIKELPGAQNRTRTCTSFLTLVPETSASTIPPPGLPLFNKLWAANETRTRDLNLGKVALYQLSYCRIISYSAFFQMRCKSSAFYNTNQILRRKKDDVIHLLLCKSVQFRACIAV